MKTTGLVAGVALAALSVGAGYVGLTAFAPAKAQAAAGAETAKAMKVDDFMLADQDYLAHQLYHLKDAKAVVLITTNVGCPIVRNNAAAYMALKKKYAAQGVEFLMIDSNLQDKRADVIKEAKEYGIDMPILMDDEQLVGEQLGVTRTAEVIVVDPKTWRVAYRGPADNRVTYERQKAEASEHYASDALDSMLAGKPIQVAQIQTEGCLINFPAKTQAQNFAKISYAHTIAPMIQQKCAVCHEPGGIGPMPLTSYEQIKGFSPMIREVVRTKRMPPYMADESVGHFQDDKRLSPDQIKTLVHWIEAGSPRGEGADPLQKVRFAAPEWPLGKPDMIIDVPAYDIPAKGIVDYQRPIVMNPVKEAEWLRASTVKVSDRQSVHHVLTGLISPENMPKDITANNEGTESKWGSSVGGYAVGSESVVAPKDHGTLIVPGGGIGFQNHYTPYGKATTEKTQIAWYFYPKGQNPTYMMHNVAIADPSIVIPPNEEYHRESAYLEFPHDAIVYGAFPHAHYRGGSSTFAIRYPDGKEVMLLALPKYDFNWQREYTFATPLKVPAGSKLIARFTYDNSKRNPANPDPNRTVPWGDQSFDEMLYTSLRYSWVGETSSHQMPELDAQLQKGRLMGMFDDNFDGKIQLSELKGKPGEGLKKNFALIDQNHDGVIDAKEWATAVKFMSGGRKVRTASSTGDSLVAGSPAAAAAPAAAPAPAKPTTAAEAKPAEAKKPITTASR